MFDLLLCRICAKKGADNLLKLFDGEQMKAIRQFQELTGKTLKYEQDSPQYICQTCVNDLQKSFEFRLKLLTVQYYFTTPQYLRKLKIARQSHTRRQNNTKIKVKKTTAVELIATAALTENEIYPPEVNPDSITLNQECAEKPAKKKRQPIPSICDYCGMVFTGRGYLKIHLRRHEGNRPYQCDLCPRTFYLHTDMKCHRRIHTGELPYACKYCGKRFRLQGARDRHLTLHTNVRAYACKLCDKKYKRSYSLKVHMISHTGESRHTCTLCDKLFQSNALLVKHYRSNSHIQNAAKQASTNESIDD